jgi:GNAT superfamily N-acetyltransferase
MTTVIRPLSSSQLENNVSVLADLLIDVVHGGAMMGFHAPLAHDEARAYWLSLRRELQASTRLLLVAHYDGRIVGSGQLALPGWPNARHRAELQKLFVGNAMQGCGIGKLLVAALHDAARDRGRSLILLGARRGGRAERFYKALGYEEIGVIPGYAVGAAGERYDNVSLYQELG